MTFKPWIQPAFFPTPRATVASRARTAMLAVVCVAGLALLTAAPGDLDPTFGNGGKVYVPFTTVGTGTSTEIHDAVVQPDGKIVIAGHAQPSLSSNTDFLIARFNVDGSLDTSFGGVGFVYVDFGLNGTAAASADRARGVALKADGTIVAVGEALTPSGFKLAIATISPNGQILNAAAHVLVTGQDHRLFDVAIDADGSIVTVGSVNKPFGLELVIAKFAADLTATWAVRRGL